MRRAGPQEKRATAPLSLRSSLEATVSAVSQQGQDFYTSLALLSQGAT